MDFLESTNYKQKPGWMKTAFWVLATIVFLGGVATATYFFIQYKSLQKNPVAAAQADTASTVTAVGKLIVLPTDEQPTVATVTDPSKLGNQSFFAHAKAGDKVLLYANAKKAILYDPSINKIVEVAPIDLSDSNAPGATTQTPTVTGDSTTTGQNPPTGK